MTIYKAYDIRGKFGDDLTEEIAYGIGRAFVTLTKTSDVMVGHDCRVHSPALAAALIRGIIDQGANVTDIGLASTPQTISMHIRKKHETAIMVTASHLDAPFNGFKLYAQAGKNITINNGMKDIEQLVLKNEWASASPGSITHANYTEEYAKNIFNNNPIRSSKPFVVDCSNGSVGPELTFYEKHLNLIIINREPDGTFPCHSPNPISPGAQQDIVNAIKKHNAVGGCIFDADADRIVFFDENASAIHPNATSCLIIAKLLKDHPGRVVAYDLISSRVLPQTILSHGGKPLRTRVGRNVLVEDMRVQNAIFAAETSSHMIYESINYADATTLSMLIMIGILEKSPLKFSELAGPIMRYALLPETNYEIENPDEAISALEEVFTDATTDHLDGVSFTFPYGWVNARKSNTEPLLRIRAETDTQEQLKALFERIEKVIIAHGGKKSHH